MLPGFKPNVCLIPVIKPHPGSLETVLIGGVVLTLADALEYAKQIGRAVHTQRRRKREAANRLLTAQIAAVQ